MKFIEEIVCVHISFDAWKELAGIFCFLPFFFFFFRYTVRYGAYFNFEIPQSTHTYGCQWKYFSRYSGKNSMITVSGWLDPFDLVFKLFFIKQKKKITLHSSTNDNHNNPTIIQTFLTLARSKRDSLFATDSEKRRRQKKKIPRRRDKEPEKRKKPSLP